MLLRYYTKFNRYIKTIKKKAKPKNKKLSGFDDIQRISNMKKCKIILHDKTNLNDILKVFDPIIKDKRTKIKEPVHIAYDNNHYYGMVSKKK